MFDVGFSELILLAVVALIVLGPEKLPHAARMAGAWLGRIRRTMTNIQVEIEKEVAAQEMRDRINKEIERLKAVEANFNSEVHAVENSIRSTLNDAASTVDAAPAAAQPAIAATPAPATDHMPAPSTPATTPPTDVPTDKTP